MTENIRAGDFNNISGEVILAGRDVYKGYSPDQVSALLTQIRTTFQPKPFDGRCPYKGLDAFEEEDAELFYGREKLVNDLIGRMGQTRGVFITGPSGSGKSSLVRAGLIPALRRGQLKNSDHWRYETMKPGRDPLAGLGRVASSLARTLSAGEDIRAKGLTDSTVFSQWCEIALEDGRDKRLVLFVDQFEEVFTQVSKEVDRAAFLNLITHAARVEDGRVIILFAMRSDFIANCAAYPALNALLSQQFVQIGAMEPAELVSAIAQPALRVDLQIDPKLIAQIINDMEGEPGSLPLVQFALKDLFDAEQAQGGIIALKLQDYLERGGIHKALERHADTEFNKLTRAEQSLAENLFKGLVEIGSNAPDTRRLARFDEFSSPGWDALAFDSVVRRLADARLISTDENKVIGRTITLSHEKLIEAWPWLKQLIDNNRLLIQLQNQILEDAAEWERHNRDRSYLYAGTRLASIERKLNDLQISNEKVRIFMRASREASRRTRVQQLFVTGLLLLMGFVIYFAAIRPLFQDQLQLQAVDLEDAGVNTLQMLPDGTIYAGLFNNRIKNGGPCLAQRDPATNAWNKFGPICAQSVAVMWINPDDTNRMYFVKSDETGIYRSLDRGQKWERVGADAGLPMKAVSSLAGSEDGLLFMGDLKAAVGVYQSSDQGNTWAPVEGSPRTAVFTLMWVPQQGLLVGGNGGLWLWKPNGTWEQLVALDTTTKDQRILSVTVLPADLFTVLAGGEDGIYLWKEGDPAQRIPQNSAVKNAWSLVFVARPEPYILALTFTNGEIWRMSPDGKNPVLMKTLGSEGYFSLVVQNEDPLRLWAGAVNGLYSGDWRKRIFEFTNKEQ